VHTGLVGGCVPGPLLAKEEAGRDPRCPDGWWNRMSWVWLSEGERAKFAKQSPASE
jgi:hypothetical protein